MLRGVLLAGSATSANHRQAKASTVLASLASISWAFTLATVCEHHFSRKALASAVTSGSVSSGI
ncbi:MAG: hypothetical protein AW09_004476 [Candidatus Accumulibacter phosphatis]|uniref:Uncharacterized protein n=1 Tax=Candidatus Accumulibacter phosphatis TaxID=327160 RepID=A0A084Y6U6_9PROT|nr:MAG: hypothetical protein AW09_004476 [Candidatus Accumulibacter phosphatis]